MSARYVMAQSPQHCPPNLVVGQGLHDSRSAGSCLHTMGILQVYQANLPKELDEGKLVGPGTVRESSGYRFRTLCTIFHWWFYGWFGGNRKGFMAKSVGDKDKSKSLIDALLSLKGRLSNLVSLV